MRMQCKVLYVGNYPNPSFSPLGCCSIIRFSGYLGYAIFELSSIFSSFAHLYFSLDMCMKCFISI